MHARDPTRLAGRSVRAKRWRCAFSASSERELDAIDSILSVLGAADSAEAERSARTLASLARALKEVMRLAAPEQASDPDDDDPMPRDLDEFRRELARRIEALAAEAEGQAPGDGG